MQMMRSLEAGCDPARAQRVSAAMEKAISLGRYDEADDIASLMVFLAPDESRFITDAQHRFDGSMGMMQKQ